MTPPAEGDEPPIGGRPGRRVSFGLAATVLVTPAAVAPLYPGLAAALYSAELLVLLTVLLTAVYAPTPISERAFRLLRWMTGRPEPTHPTSPDQPPGSRPLPIERRHPWMQDSPHLRKP